MSSSLPASSSVASLEDKEVTLHIESLKTFTIKVKGSETIHNIKAIIKQKEGALSTHYQELIISGNQLKDGNRLQDYITAGNSTVNVVCREKVIYLNLTKITSSGIVSTGLQAKLSHTVGQLKSMIDTAEGTRSEYHLIFDGDRLQDDMTLGGSGLMNDSILYMVLDPVDTLQLQIAMPCGRVEKITVKRLHKIFDLKVALQKEIDMPIDQWHLAYSARTLEDFNSFSYYGVQADSLLSVVLPAVQIFVRNGSVLHNVVDINLTDCVFSLKNKILAKTLVPVKHQMLLYSGRLLFDLERLLTYGIKKNSTVELRIKV